MIAMLLRTCVLTAALSVSSLFAPAVSAETPQDAQTTNGTLLSITASAESSRIPDIALISTGVLTQSSEANTAMRDNAEQMNKVMAALRSAGIAARDIQTSGINLSPQYKYAENSPPQVIGYQANNTVNVKVRNLERLGTVLDALVAQGANQINGPSFSIDQPEAAFDEARVAAIKKAQAQAKLYADTLGMRVLRIVRISEGSTIQPMPRPMYRMNEMMLAKAADTAVSAGESSVSVSVDMVFELAH